MTRFPCPERRRIAAAVLLLVLLGGILCAVLAQTAPVWPASGKKTAKNGGMTVDYSNCAKGYIMVTAPSSKKRLKVRIKHGDDYYNYDISPGEKAVYPLQMGSGGYTVLLYENKSGNQYAQKAKVTFNAKLESEYAPFLCPSQYVWYTKSSPAVAKSNELCKGLKTDA